jgi:Zn-dependent peptidase ImmA (M78 family)
MDLVEDFSPAKSFLLQATEQDPPQLYQAFADYLLETANCRSLPIALDDIRKRHGFRFKKAPIPQRGLLYDDIIVVNLDDPDTVQAFSQAHEMMESLTVALRQETVWRFPKISPQMFAGEKERWCELGAATLLMPKALFFPLVQQHSVSLDVARYLAGRCGTSLTATIRRMLDANVSQTIFVLWAENHKKNEVVPTKVGQGVLWGDPAEWDPPAQLRVMRSWSAPDVNVRICQNESVSRQSSLYATLASAIPGRVNIGYENLNLEFLKKEVRTESMLVKINNAPVVMSLIHL